MNILTGTLVVNAASSALTGIALLVGAGALADRLGIPLEASVVVGVGLLIFAFAVARTARHPHRGPVVGVILADVAWVFGAGLVLFVCPETMSTEGLVALGFVSVAVAMFAILQAVGLRRLGVAV